MTYSSVTVTGYNVSPPPDDGSQVSSNVADWAGIKDKLTDPLKTAIESINTNVGSEFTDIQTQLDAIGGTFVSAYLSADQSLTQNADTLVIFDTEVGDTASDYDNTTGVFTARKTGQYLVTVAAEGKTLSDGNPFDSRLYVNGSSARQMWNLDCAKSSAEVANSAAAILDLTAADTVDFRCYTEESGKVVAGGETLTWIMIFRLA
jgi:hypothetical protein